MPGYGVYLQCRLVPGRPPARSDPSMKDEVVGFHDGCPGAAMPAGYILARLRACEMEPPRGKRADECRPALEPQRRRDDGCRLVRPLQPQGSGIHSYPAQERRRRFAQLVGEEAMEMMDGQPCLVSQNLSRERLANLSLHRADRSQDPAVQCSNAPARGTVRAAYPVCPTRQGDIPFYL